MRRATRRRRADLPRERRRPAIGWRSDDERAGAASGRAARRPSRRWAASSPNYYVQDGVDPRTRLPEVLRGSASSRREYGLRVANVFHAGDGNLHPLICYDASVPGEPSAPRARRRHPRAAASRRRHDHRRARGRHRQVRVPAVHVRGGRPGRDASGCGARSIRRAWPIRARSCPRPGLCGEAPGPYRQHPLEAAGVAERL